MSQGVPPRTSESATPNVGNGPIKETKRGIVKQAVKDRIPPSSPFQLRRPVGNITLPNKGMGGPGPTQPTDPSAGGILSNPMVGGMGSTAYAINGSNLGPTMGQNQGTNQNQAPIDLNPTNLPQNLKKNNIPLNPDLTPQPPDATKQPQTFLPGKSRVKPKSSVSNSIVKKMLKSISNRKTN